MSTLSTTVRRGLVVTAAAVAAGPIVGGVASATTGPTATAPLDTAGIPATAAPAADGALQSADLMPVARTAPLPTGGLGSLPLAGGLTKSLPVGGLQGLPLAGPALSGLSSVVPMNGMLNGLIPAQAPAAAPAPAFAAPAPAVAAPAPARPATRSRKSVTPPHSAAAPQLLAGMPMTDTPLGPEAPSISSLPQYAGVKKVAELGPMLADAKVAEDQKGPVLPVIGELPKNGLPVVGELPKNGLPVVDELPLNGLAKNLPAFGPLGSLHAVSGLLSHF